MKTYLSGDDWQVKGFDQYVPIKETSMETGVKLTGITDWIQSEVPGGIHSDLYRNNRIPNPTKDNNSYLVEWVERRWWMYKKIFDYEIVDDKKYNLVFEGIDYEASFYLNDVHLGDHIGMFTKATFDISKVIKSNDNILVVVFKHVPDEMGQIGYTSRTQTQKSRFNYKWDFSARIVNIGIWKDVYIAEREAVEVSNIYIHTDWDKQHTGLIHISYDLMCPLDDDKRIKIEYLVSDPQGKIEFSESEYCDGLKSGMSKTIHINNPRLWDVNGYGLPNLYTIEVTFFYNGLKSHHLKRKIGIRSIAYSQNKTNYSNALPYTFVINGNKVYIKGVNITPLDTMYGSVKKEQYEQLVRQAVNANINLIRVWGGGLIEKEIFYDLCDQNGILVWQDFIQSSSGIDNQPSHDEAFLRLLENTATEAIIEKRNHTSLACWCGGNELMDRNGCPISFNDPNISLLKSLVEKYNPEIFFYPSTASGPTEFHSNILENHDIHGGWEYKGNPDHYIHYNKSNALFHSEFGTEGTASYKSIRKFISPEHCYPSEMNKNSVYINHGAWWGTYRRDQKIFYPLTDMKMFINCGQYMHSEGLRYILEGNRRRKFENSGSIIWQLNEPFPNVSCTSLIDYYGECKPAYYYAKRCFANRHVSMSYEKLDYFLGEVLSNEIYVNNGLETLDIQVVMTVQNVYGDMLWEKKVYKRIDENCSDKVGVFDYKVLEKGLFICTLKLYCNEALIDENRYVFSTQQEHPYQDFEILDTNVAIVEQKEMYRSENRLVQMVTIKNVGEMFAPLAGIELIEDEYYLLCDNNFIDLLPGEEKIIRATIYGKKVGSFIYTESLRQQHLSPTIKVGFFGEK